MYEHNLRYDSARGLPRSCLLAKRLFNFAPSRHRAVPFRLTVLSIRRWTSPMPAGLREIIKQLLITALCILASQRIGKSAKQDVICAIPSTFIENEIVHPGVSHLSG